MWTRVLLLASVVFLTTSCGGGDKHLPSSNPPEYDPKKVYSSPASPAPSLHAAMQPPKPESPRAAMPTPCERPPIKPSDLEKPPIVCGGGSGGAGGSGGGGGDGGGGEKKKSTDGAAKHPSYVLEFRSMIVATDTDGQPAQSQASAILQLNTQEEEKPGAGPKYTGQGTITYNTGPLPNWGPCTPLIRGEGTVPLCVFQTFIHVEEQESGSAVLKRGTAKIE